MGAFSVPAQYLNLIATNDKGQTTNDKPIALTLLFDFNIYSSLLLIFFVHGLVYAALLWARFSSAGKRPDAWLSLFLLLCVLYITPWMVGFAGWYDTQPYRDFLFYTPFQHLFALGPVVYFYVQSLLNPSFRLSKKQALHFIPAAFYLLFTLLIWVTDKIVLREYWFLADGVDPDFARWYQVSGFISMGTYGLAALRYHQRFRLLMLQVTSFADRLRFTAVRRFLLVFTVMLALRLLFFIIALLGSDDYAATWWYFFGFALLFYSVAIAGYTQAQQGSVAYKPVAGGALLLQPAQELQADGISFIAEEEPITIEETPPAPAPLWEIWIPRIQQVMELEGAYRDPELNLSGLARKLGLPSAQLSRIINGHFGCNFNDFVNGYRVRAVQMEIEAGAHRLQTLLGIAYDCGFNSKATFNRAFQKHAGATPKAFTERAGS